MWDYASHTLLFIAGRVPRAPLLPQQKLRRFICYFYETIKVTKSVFKRKGPLENLLWGTPRSGLCVYDTRSRGVIPAVTFGHAPLLHLG